MADGRIERGKATRDRLVEVARGLFGEHGYEGTSIEAVLGAAGVKRGALYHHFDSKQALFDAVLDRTISDVAEHIAEEARAAPDAVASLRAGCAAWLRIATDPPLQRIGLLDAPAVVGWSRWREIDEQHTLGGVRRNLQLIADEGRLPDADVDVLAHMVLASVSEASLLIARADDQQAALEKGLVAVDALIDGLVKRR